MLEAHLPIHNWLLDVGRLPVLSRPGKTASAAEWGILFLSGFLAACATTMVDLKLRIPGHAILLATLPLTLGIAMVPRRFGGTIMAAIAGVSSLGIVLSGGTDAAPGAGALTSLLLLGPLLDLALERENLGWWLYVRIMASALAANLAAFLVRSVAARYLGDGVHGQNIIRFWPYALTSHLICGAIAGLISAAICFRGTKRPPSASNT